MSWFKMARHDLRCGSLRWRYLAAAAFTLLPCMLFRDTLKRCGQSGTWMDYLFYLFLGKEPILYAAPGQRIEMPLMWLLLMGGCLFLNLDYLLTDLTNAGQQIIIRSRNRMGWYLSKCLWNFCSCGEYIAIAALTAAVFTLAGGGKLSAGNTPDMHVLWAIFGFSAGAEAVIPPVHGILAGLLFPFLTLSALSMLEMTLCLMVKPVVSFLAVLALLVLSVLWNSPFALGIGAMTIRSDLLVPLGIDSWLAAGTALAVILACVAAGTLRFRHTDILGLEE